MGTWIKILWNIVVVVVVVYDVYVESLYPDKGSKHRIQVFSPMWQSPFPTESFCQPSVKVLTNTPHSDTTPCAFGTWFNCVFPGLLQGQGEGMLSDPVYAVLGIKPGLPGCWTILTELSCIRSSADSFIRGTAGSPACRSDPSA